MKVTNRNANTKQGTSKMNRKKTPSSLLKNNPNGRSAKTAAKITQNKVTA